ncbi:hypothetical protein Tco_0812379 [Tanacetum coccineum]
MELGRDVDYFSITVEGGIAHHGNEVLPKLKQHGSFWFCNLCDTQVYLLEVLPVMIGLGTNNEALLKYLLCMVLFFTYKFGCIDSYCRLRSLQKRLEGVALLRAARRAMVRMFGHSQATYDSALSHRETVKYLTNGGIIGAMSTAAFAWKYLKSPHGTREGAKFSRESTYETVTGPPESIKMYPDVDLEESLHLAKSISK